MLLAWSVTPHRDGDLSQDVLRDGQALLNHLLVELVQGRVHQLHADPHIALATQIWEEVSSEITAPKKTWPGRLTDRKGRKRVSQVQSH